MIEKIKGISVKGKCFAEYTKLLLFPNEKNRMSIIYGKNGSGKSTISEGFSYISSKNDSTEVDVELFDYDNINMSLPDNIKIEKEGLNTIILFGEQKDLQCKIDDYCLVKLEVESIIKEINNSLEAYNDPNDPYSPDYHMNTIKKNLQRKWAQTDGELKGNKINSKVTDEVISKIVDITVSESLEKLYNDYNEKNKLLIKISNNNIKHHFSIKTIDIDSNFEIDVIRLLLKKINKPTLTEREKLIMDEVEHGRQTLIYEAKKDFSSRLSNICPYCFREIGDIYKKDLIDSINKVLNPDVDIHKTELVEIQWPDFSIDYHCYNYLDDELIQNIVSEQDVCRSIIEQYRAHIDNKYNNIYSPIEIKSLGLLNHINKLNNLISKLELKRIEYNDSIQNKSILLNELKQINDKIAHLEIEQEYTTFCKQKTIRDNLQKLLTETNKCFQTINKHIEELEQRKSNINLAIVSINNSLKYVFFDNNRLVIELKDDKYYLKSNGKNVKPRDISIGERNAIALCYFFTQIFSKEEILKMYSTEILIVLDDAISSFDFENKIGIMSFLRYQIKKILMGNRNSRVLIFSHDLTAMYDFQKISKEMEKISANDEKLSKISNYCGELFDYQIRSFNNRRSEYGQLLEDIYKYAKSPTSDLEYLIGNIIRRVLEAFSTFSYRKSIEEVTRDQGVIKQLGNKSTYFENLMYRLLLHGDSHYEEQVKSLYDNMNFNGHISPEEKQRVSKDVLCLIYLLNPHHIIAYLNNTGAIDDIKVWIDEIPINDLLHNISDTYS